MTRCARERRTFFWEEPVLDEAATESRLQIRDASPGLRVAAPHLPAGLGDEEIQDEQRRLLDEMLATHSVRDPVLWLYTPMALPLVRHISASAVIYDCMDELSAFRGAPPSLTALEAELFARADVIFTGGRSLYEAKRQQHARVHAFPSSVDCIHFERARDTRLPAPADQRDIPRPRIGYFGVIDERIDLDLLAGLADDQPSWQLVMVGPIVKIDPATVPRRPNIHYLGQKSYDSLPSYISGWDVAVMPFALNESTRFISPTKTLEYLAAGKPVVSTPIRDVVDPYGERGLVRIGDRESFAGEIAAAIVEHPAPRRQLADAFVATTSWDRTWSRMSEILRDISAEKESVRVNGFGEGMSACSTI